LKDLQEQFGNEGYYQADLNRVCEMEELAIEWYDLDLTNENKRKSTLETFGFCELVDNDDDFIYIIN